MLTWRVPAAAAVLVICLSAIGYATFPQAPHRNGGATIRLPDRSPSDARWQWPDGVPGWKPGQTIKGFNVSGVQPVELQAAQLAAAHRVLDADGVRVVSSLRGDQSGPLAIVATRTLYATPAITCLGAVLTEDAPVTWLCPDELAGSHVLIAAKSFPGNGFDFTGVARGDVTRIVQGRHEIYVRGRTWGEFQATSATRPGMPLRVYVGHSLVETVPLDLAAGEQRVLR